MFFYTIVLCLGHFAFFNYGTMAESNFIDIPTEGHTLAFPDVAKLKYIASDNLELPGCLKALKPKSNTISRRRRFLSLSSTLTVSVRLQFPGQYLLGLSSVIALRTAFKFAIPANLQFTGWGGNWGRELSGHNRTYFFGQIEKLFEGFGTDGQQCLLRTICEIAELPFDHGLIGEIVNFLFSITTSPNEINSTAMVIPNEYRKAKELGQNRGECSSVYSLCPLSFLDLISKLHLF